MSYSKEMSKPVFTFLMLIISVFANAQKNAIEVSFVGRYDRHASYNTSFGATAGTDTIKLYGKSYGFNVLYRHKIKETISVFIGGGYYKLKIDQIETPMPYGFGGIKKTRRTDYNDGNTNLLYSASKYHYNNFVVTIGINKTFLLKNGLHLDLGIDETNFFTFSQQYQLDNAKKYSTSNSKPHEFGINATIGLLKEYNKLYIRPSFLIPVYQRLKGDNVFLEDKNLNVQKWLNGYGFVLKAGIFI